MTDPIQELPSTYAVGDWLIDGDTLTARRGERVQSLEPRAYNVLRYLAERPGRLVTIDELMDVHWRGTVVTPNAVTRVIAQIRKALDDDARNPAYIETVARTGYRLIAGVSGDARISKRKIALAAALLVAILAGVAWMLTPDAPDKASIAVYPFENFTGDPDLEYIGEGVAEEVINALARVPQFSVTARSISFRYAATGQDPQRFAQDLGVHYFVEGSVRRSGQTLRFTAQLIEVEDGNHVWSRTSEHQLEDLFEGQDAISTNLTTALADVLDVAFTAAGRRANQSTASRGL